MEHRPILVTGCPRSGTTWVGKVLGAAPEVFYIYEPFNDDAPHHLPVPERFIDLSLNAPADLLHDLDEIMRLRAFGTRASGLLRWGLERSMRRAPNRAARHAAACLSRRRQQFFSATRVCLKDPLAFYSAEWLAEHYDAEVVVLVRHPAGVVSSYLGLDWLPEHEAILARPPPPGMPDLADDIERYRAGGMSRLEALVLQWRVFTAHTLDMQARRPDWTFILHEALCDDPVGEFSRLFGALSIPFTDHTRAVIEEGSGEGNAVDGTKHVQHSHKRASRDLASAWRKRLSDADIDYILQKAGGLWEEAQRRLAPAGAAVAPAVLQPAQSGGDALPMGRAHD